MRTIVLLVILLCSLPYTLDGQTSPILIKDTKQKVVIYDSVLTDSFKVVYRVIVQFKYPLEDINKEIIVKNVRMHPMSIQQLNDTIQHINFKYDYNELSHIQKHIWNVCLSKFNKWYREQPYEEYLYRKMLLRNVTFGGVVYLKPNDTVLP